MIPAQTRAVESRASIVARPEPGEPAPSLHATLRAATRAPHEALDRGLARFDLTERVAYRRFLRVHLSALTVLADRWGPEHRTDIETWIACLHEDLGAGPADRDLSYGRRFGGRHDEAGLAYVVRGSRLGAAHLLQRVGAGLPTAYLACPSVVSWRNFLASIEPLAGAHGTRRIVTGACSAFAVFARAAEDDAAVAA